jgi:hypothetical protein
MHARDGDYLAPWVGAHLLPNPRRRPESLWSSTGPNRTPRRLPRPACAASQTCRDARPETLRLRAREGPRERIFQANCKKVAEAVATAGSPAACPALPPCLSDLCGLWIRRRAEKRQRGQAPAAQSHTKAGSAHPLSLPLLALLGRGWYQLAVLVGRLLLLLPQQETVVWLSVLPTLLLWCHSCTRQHCADQLAAIACLQLDCLFCLGSRTSLPSCALGALAATHTSCLVRLGGNAAHGPLNL